MKELFKEAMRHMYASGVPETQLADLIRVYSMGWADSLLNTTGRVGVNDPIIKATLHWQYLEWMRMCKPLCESDFVPDDSWKWW